MHGVKAVRTVHEVSRTLRRASDAAELGNALRLHAHFIHRVNDAFGNCVVSATRAERSLPAAIVNHLQSNPVGLWSRNWSRNRWRRVGGSGPHVTCPPSS